VPGFDSATFPKKPQSTFFGVPYICPDRATLGANHRWGWRRLSNRPEPERIHMSAMIGDGQMMKNKAKMMK
jgi:hypothetical protein